MKTGKYALSAETNDLYKKTTYKFPTRHVASSFPNQYWSVDLVDMSNKSDKGYKYIFNFVDVFSRKLFSYPIKSKSTDDMLETLKKAISEHGKPGKIWTDKEGALLSGKVQQYLKSQGIETYHTYGRGKSAIVENLQRTQKSAIEQVTHGKSWRKHVEPFEQKYNNVKHSFINTTPNSAFNQTDEGEAITQQTLRQIDAFNPKEVAKFGVGSKVRLQIKKTIFSKGYTQRWTSEIFTIAKILYTNPRTYKVKDGKGEIIQGSFYKEELQEVKNRS